MHQGEQPWVGVEQDRYVYTGLSQETPISESLNAFTEVVKPNYIVCFSSSETSPLIKSLLLFYLQYLATERQGHFETILNSFWILCSQKLWIVWSNHRWSST